MRKAERWARRGLGSGLVLFCRMTDQSGDACHLTGGVTERHLTGRRGCPQPVQFLMRLRAFLYFSIFLCACVCVCVYCCQRSRRAFQLFALFVSSGLVCPSETVTGIKFRYSYLAQIHLFNATAVVRISNSS